MPLRIEDYALIGDTETAALVGNDGSIDWLCLPRFDSAACFCALLGKPEHGRWQIAPAGGLRRVTRRYRPGTLVLETDFETEDGVARIIDCMPPRDELPDIVRVVQGVRGAVPLTMELAPRFDYGRLIPWVRDVEHAIHIVAGPDALFFESPVAVEHDNRRITAELSVRPGDQVAFRLGWHPSHTPLPEATDALEMLDYTESWWRRWSSSCRVSSDPNDAVTRSLITLKALTYAPTGGIVAAPTTSLPEHIGSVRNWDYRFCWLRDATFTLYALLSAGYRQEAIDWRDWLLRAVAGDPSQLQIMYGLAGEHRLPELELSWLPGYENSRPVRVGNAAVGQLQLDVLGEVIDTFHLARELGVPPQEDEWALSRAMLEHLERRWSEPDEGIWEVRGPRQHFTHSKVMAWTAMDRAVRGSMQFGLEGPVDRWRSIRDEIHREVCEKAWDSERRTFVQAYGSNRLDASVLQMALVGFLPPHDLRIRGTVDAIERELVRDGFVYRYLPDDTVGVDGLPPGEGAFLACTFWLADNLTLIGRPEDGRRYFSRVLDIRNDVGLLAEEYDPALRRLVGNFPQAFSHVYLIHSAENLAAYGEEEARSLSRPSCRPPPA